MSNTENAIEVKNLSKKFVYYPSQRDRLFDLVSGGRAQRGTDFWALKDISFEVPKGSTFGIIGKNGSGKSTLLSILAGVLQPTSGEYIVNGKVAAILELGSGFHHEFTGRENVYMYGAILGLSRAEIDRRFDEIVEFSELQEFIDRPLYTYSSGMIARLAFACAVNVDADILIVDEVLAVGDVLFQHRCFRKIKAMQEEGRTILYVGHDVESIRFFCDNTALFNNGRILKYGDANEIVDLYIAHCIENERLENQGSVVFESIDSSDKTVRNFETEFEKNDIMGNRFGTMRARIIKVELVDENNIQRTVFQLGEVAVIKIYAKAFTSINKGFTAGFVIRNKNQNIYATNGFWLEKDTTFTKEDDELCFNFKFPMNIGAGLYTISAVLNVSYSHDDGEICDWINDVLFFSIEKNSYFVGITDLKAVHSFVRSKSYADDVRECFTNIYKKKIWGDAESLSGTGSSLQQTKNLRSVLPVIAQRLGIKTLLDIPCGDFNWMRHVDLNEVHYRGGDVVSFLIDENKTKYENANRHFFVIDLISEIPPKADIILCRDLIVHLSITQIYQVLRNIIASGSRYVLITTFVKREYNHDIQVGGWRPINLCATPFLFPEPIELINEQCSEEKFTFADKSLGLWDVSVLKNYLG